MKNKFIISILTIILVCTLAFSLVACNKEVICYCPEPTAPCECPTTPTPPRDCPEPTPPCECPAPTPPCECPPPIIEPPLQSSFNVAFVRNDISTESYISSTTSQLPIGSWFVTTFNITNNNTTVMKLDFSLSFGNSYQSKSITQIPTVSGSGMIRFSKYYASLPSSTDYAKHYLTDHFYLSPNIQLKVIVAFYIPPRDYETNTQYTMEDGNFNLMIKQHDATTNTYTLLKTVPVTGTLYVKPI